MCIASLIPAHVDVPWDDLINGTLANRDGHGWACAEGDTIKVGKSMDPETALADAEQARLDMGKGSILLFHSRIGTHGTRSEFNVHPFYVGPEQKTVMAHNGILPFKYHPGKDDARSDTRVFADSIGHLVDHQFGLPSRRISGRMAQEIGTGNKLVFLSVKSGRARARIINPNLGVFTGGVWHSNHSFEDKPYYHTRHTAWDYTYDRGWERPTGGAVVRYLEPSRDFVNRHAGEKCPKCESVGHITRTNECLACATCLDCGSKMETCQCYGGYFEPSLRPVLEKCPLCGSYDVDRTDFDLELFLFCNECRSAWSRDRNDAVRVW